MKPPTDVIDLAAVRAARRGPPPSEPDYYCRADGEHTVTLQLPVDGVPELEMGDEAAEQIGHDLLRAARESRIRDRDRCKECGKPWCRDFHVGQLREGWRRRGNLRYHDPAAWYQVNAIVERLTPRGAILRDLDRGTSFRVDRRRATGTWRLRGWAGPQPPPRPADTAP